MRGKEDITKLPRWARNRISVLERNIEDRRKRDAEQGILTYAESKQKGMLSQQEALEYLRLPSQHAIVFGFGEKSIEVRFTQNQNELFVTSSPSGLVITPEVSNAVRIRVKDWRE